MSTLRKNDVIAAGGKIVPTSQKAMAYGGAQIKFCGETLLHVTYGGTTKFHKFLVVDSNYVNLFGRDLCQFFNLKLFLPDRQSIFNIKESVIKKHSE